MESVWWDADPVSVISLQYARLNVFTACNHAEEKHLTQKRHKIATRIRAERANIHTGEQHLCTVTLRHLIQECNRKCTHDD